MQAEIDEQKLKKIHSQHVTLGCLLDWVEWKRKETKKGKVFALFDKGLGPQDVKVKKVVADYKYRHKLYEMWKESHSVFKVDTLKEERGVAKGASTSDTLEAPAQVLHPKKPPIVIGHMSIPYEDWGYSTTAHMLVVASTYQEVKSEYGYSGPVGDFCADCVKLFRRIFDFDPIREEEMIEEADGWL